MSSSGVAGSVGLVRRWWFERRSATIAAARFWARVWVRRGIMTVLSAQRSVSKAAGAMDPVGTHRPPKIRARPG